MQRMRHKGPPGHAAGYFFRKCGTSSPGLVDRRGFGVELNAIWVIGETQADGWLEPERVGQWCGDQFSGLTYCS